MHIGQFDQSRSISLINYWLEKQILSFSVSSPDEMDIVSPPSKRQCAPQIFLSEDSPMCVSPAPGPDLKDAGPKDPGPKESVDEGLATRLASAVAAANYQEAAEVRPFFSFVPARATQGKRPRGGAARGAGDKVATPTFSQKSRHGNSLAQKLS